MLLDTQGFAIPFHADDAVIECGACDPEYGDPETWPAWVDDWRYSPTEADSVWAAQNLELPPPFEPTDADLDEMARWSGALTDDDLAAAGLPVG